MPNVKKIQARLIFYTLDLQCPQVPEKEKSINSTCGDRQAHRPTDRAMKSETIAFKGCYP